MPRAPIGNVLFPTFDETQNASPHARAPSNLVATRTGKAIANECLITFRRRGMGCLSPHRRVVLWSSKRLWRSLSAWLLNRLRDATTFQFLSPILLRSLNRDTASTAITAAHAIGPRPCYEYVRVKVALALHDRAGTMNTFVLFECSDDLSARITLIAIG